MFTHLVLSGGGLAGTAYIGALARLQEHPGKDDIRHVIGTSIGALMGFLFVLRINMLEVQAYVRANWLTPEMLEIGDATCLLNLLNDCGVVRGDRYLAFMKHFLRRALGVTDITFVELTKATGMVLTICVTDLIDACAHYFSVDKTPDVSVLSALAASMAVPLFFVPVEINGRSYVDGAVTANFPIDAVNKDIIPDAVIGMHIVAAKKSYVSPTASLANLMQSLLGALLNLNHLEQVLRRYKNIVVMDRCPVPNFPMEVSEAGVMAFRITESDVAASYAYGYSVMDSMLTGLSSRT